MNSLILWVAQGFGIGRLPIAPGTYGSLLGIGWFFALLATGNPWFYAAGTIVGLGLSVWTGGHAEKILHQTDPGSVVLDEISAFPICFLMWLIAAWHRTGAWPVAQSFFTSTGILHLAIAFALFRFFDICKPWPVRQSQSLPGGWGITADDCLAALYTAIVAYLILMVLGKHTAPQI
jgi:phosphatidylglycerophosphatase A